MSKNKSKFENKIIENNQEFVKWKRNIADQYSMFFNHILEYPGINF